MSNFFLDLKCPVCGGELASDSHSLYELKAWCAECGWRFRLVIVGKNDKGETVFRIVDSTNGG